MGVIDTRTARDASRRRPEADSDDEDQGAQIREIVSVLVRRRGLMATAFMMLFIGVAAAIMLSPPRYEASALVMVNPSREQVLAQEQMVDNAAPNSSVVDSEIEILRSQSVMRQLVDALELDESPEWNPSLRAPGPMDAVRSALRGGIAAEPRSGQELRNTVATAVARAITVRRRGNSYGIEVTVEASQPGEAARMANTLVDLYLRTQTEARFETAQRANSWLEDQLEQLRLELQEKERQAEAFRQAHGLSVAAGAGAAAAGAQSSDVQTMLVTARADLAEKEARLRQVQELLRSGGSAESMAGALSSPVIAELRTRETELTRQQADMAQRYSAEHPDLLAVRTQLAEVRDRIGDETARITENLRNEVQIARARLGTLQGSFGIASGANEEDNEAVIQYRQLVSEAAAARAVHESFLQRYHEVSNQGDLPTATSRLASTAEAPAGPSKPSLNFALLAALATACLGAALAALLAEVFDGSMLTAEDVERKVGVATVASVPVLKSTDYRGVAHHRRNPTDYLVEKPMSAFAEALRVLRTSVMHARLDRKVRVLAVTSAVPNEGKTTLSSSLARICAMSGQRVMLVDCDLRRQSLSELLDLRPSSGLVQVLGGQTDWRNALVEDPETGAHILLAASSAFTPRDLFSSPAMETLVADLRQHYDLVILDCAPVLAIAETRLIVTHADAVALVARSQRTHAAAVRTAVREVENSGAAVLGVALNCVDPRAPGRNAYADTLYYRYAKKNYYAE
jgi:polysaccharide biosynthesis transport protein